MSEKKFRELKIDEELRDLLPPLTEDEYKQLEENIKRDGCREAIYIWKDYIVDGHNRYGICDKNNIEFETITLSSDYTKEDIKMWMLDTQLGRRNLTDVKRIIIAEKYRELIEKKAKENQIKGGENYGKGLTNSTEPINNIDTRKELAKIAGVGVEKYYRTNKILKTDNEELKDKLINGEITVNKAYKTLFPKQEVKIDDTIKNNEPNQNKRTQMCSKCGQIKDVDSFYIEHDRCKECEIQEQSQLTKYENKIKNDEFNKLLERKYSLADNSNFSVDGDLESIKEDCGDFIINLEDRLFETEKTYEKMKNEDKVNFKTIINDFIDEINNILKKII